MVKKLKVIILVFLVMFICSCDGDSVKVSNPLTESEIVNYIQNEIYKETGDDVIINIVNKKELSVCMSWFDGCVIYQAVEGGHSYEVEIINKVNQEIIGTGKYDDGYTEYDEQYTDGKREVAPSFSNNYKEQKNLFLIQNEFSNVLKEKFDKYYIYKDVSNNTGYDIFINSSNYDDINDLLLKFKSIAKNYGMNYVSYSIYIYKDEDVFNNTNFELYKNGHEDYSGQSYGKDMIEQYTGKEVVRIGSSESFNYDLFISNGASAASTDKEYVDYNSFDYLVFWCVGSASSTLSMQIFGVK